MIEKYKVVTINDEEYAVPNKDYWDEINKKKYFLLLQKSNIPDFYHTVEFCDYVGDLSIDNIHKLQVMIENIHEEKFKDINLYLWGSETGTQKTASACNFGKGCIKRGLKVRFMLFGSFVNYLLKLQGFHKDEEADFKINDLKSADIILLDDCFDPNKSIFWKKESSRDLIISELDIFFRELIYNKKRFVLTSNLSPEMINQNYGKFLYDLIDRNFIPMSFLDSVKSIRKERLGDDLWKK